MLVGYMRVSTDGDRQTFDLQRDALVSAGVDERHLFEDRVSGSRSERAGLAEALEFVRSGDCLVVWKLDRLGRSLPDLLATVTDLKSRGIGFRSLTELMDTTISAGTLRAAVTDVTGDITGLPDQQREPRRRNFYRKPASIFRNPPRRKASSCFMFSARLRNSNVR